MFTINENVHTICIQLIYINMYMYVSESIWEMFTINENVHTYMHDFPIFTCNNFMQLKLYFYMLE